MRIKFLIYSLLLVSLSWGQEINADLIFADVTAKAEKKDYDSALKSLQVLLDKYPGNEDYIIYEGRLYNWKGDYKNAESTLKPLADKPNADADALDALIHTYYWSQQYQKCIDYCNKYLSKKPGTVSILNIKANCLEKLDEDEQATALIDSIAIIENSNTSTAALRTIINKKKKNAFSASYLNITTYDPGEPPLHYGYIEYARKLKSSSIIGRANIGHGRNTTEGQFEVDYYQNFKNKTYLYLNAGVANGEFIFPVTRGGIEYYFPIKQFSFSAGVRYLNFEEDNVTLLTGHAGYNFMDYIVSYRPFYDVDNSLFSHIVALQKTDEVRERIYRIELQYGTVPYLFLYNNFTEPLRAYRVGAHYQHRLGDSFFIRPIFMYEYEEYFPSSYRHRFNAQVILTKRF